MVRHHAIQGRVVEETLNLEGREVAIEGGVQAVEARPCLSFPCVIVDQVAPALAVSRKHASDDERSAPRPSGSAGADGQAFGGSNQQQGKPPRGRMLLVDDEPFIGTSLRRLLGAEHDVIAVSSGHDALKLIAAGERFDVILCDVRMPVMNGMELYERLRVIDPAISDRMIFFTGAAFTGDMHAFFSRVSNEFLEKPFDPAVLKALVRRLVAAGPSGSRRQ